MTGLEVRVRFLQLVSRTVGELAHPAKELLSGKMPEFHLVERLAVNGRVYQPWQEAVEREVVLPVYNVEALRYGLAPYDFHFSVEKQVELLRDSTEQIIGVIVRERKRSAAPSKSQAKELATGCSRSAFACLTPRLSKRRRIPSATMPC